MSSDFFTKIANTHEHEILLLLDRMDERRSPPSERGRYGRGLGNDEEVEPEIASRLFAASAAAAAVSDVVFRNRPKGIANFPLEGVDEV